MELIERINVWFTQQNVLDKTYSCWNAKVSGGNIKSRPKLHSGVIYAILFW